MRRAVIALVLLVVLLVAALVAGDVVTVHLTESAIAKRIEQRVPGSHATVTISSSPFLYHLAASGTVEELHAHVTGVVENHYSFESIDVTVKDLEVNRGDLLRGSVDLARISNATIVATLSRDELVEAGVVVGLKHLGVLGSSAHGTVVPGQSEVTINVDGLTLTLPYSSLVPCVGTAVFTGGNLVLTCSTDTLPPALAQGSA
jgi:hypothetical protein